MTRETHHSHVTFREVFTQKQYRPAVIALPALMALWIAGYMEATHLKTGPRVELKLNTRTLPGEHNLPKRTENKGFSPANVPFLKNQHS